MAGRTYRAHGRDELAPPVAMDGFTIAYHRPSGQTHLLVEPAQEILDALGSGPADAGEVLARLARDFGIEAEDDSVAVIAARLVELADLGLITAL